MPLKRRYGPLRPSFLEWATSLGGMYLHDKPHLASFPPYQREILDHLFPRSAEGAPLPYSRIVWSCPKKSAKSTLAAALHLYFGLFIETPGEQYVLANDLDGGLNRVFRYLLHSLARNPKLTYGVDWQATRESVTLSNRTLIRAIPADLRGEAGGNQSFVSIDEPWGIIHEDGVRLATEFGPVPTRETSVVFYTGYQGWARSQWWHDLIDRGLAGEPVPSLAHLTNGDGAASCWHNGQLFVYYDHQPRMDWHTPQYLAEQRRILPRGEYLRVWENRRSVGEDMLCTPDDWDALYDPQLAPLHPGDQRLLVLAADAATRSDCTALVGCTWDGARGVVEVVYGHIWQPQEGTPLQLTATIGPEIIRLHRQHRVIGVMYDPYQMVAIAELCKREGVPMVEFPQTARRIQSDTHLHGLILAQRVRHYGDPRLREHVLSAALQPSERGVRLTKIGSGPIDAAVALSMAAHTAVEALGSIDHRNVQAARNPFYQE